MRAIGTAAPMTVDTVRSTVSMTKAVTSVYRLLIEAVAVDEGTSG